MMDHDQRSDPPKVESVRVILRSSQSQTWDLKSKAITDLGLSRVKECDKEKGTSLQA